MMMQSLYITKCKSIQHKTDNRSMYLIIVGRDTKRDKKLNRRVSNCRSKGWGFESHLKRTLPCRHCPKSFCWLSQYKQTPRDFVNICYDSLRGLNLWLMSFQLGVGCPLHLTNTSHLINFLVLGKVFGLVYWK